MTLKIRRKKMIVSRVKLNSGAYAYFDISTRISRNTFHSPYGVKSKKAIISFFVVEKDINVFFDNEKTNIVGCLKNIKAADLKGFISPENAQFMDNWGYESQQGYEVPWGENKNLISLKDVKILRAEMNNLINWLIETRFTDIVFEPVDKDRLTATIFLLKKDWRWEEKSFKDVDGDVNYRLQIEGKKGSKSILPKIYYIFWEEQNKWLKME